MQDEQTEQWIEDLLKLSDGDDKLTDKQARIIQAAVEMFATKGYAATSTSEIAQKAGVAEGTIFRHYKTKKELLIAIVAPMMSRLIAPFVLRDLDKVFGTTYTSYEEFVRAVVKNRMEFVRRNLPLLKILLQEIPFHPEMKELFKQHVGIKVIERIRSVVEHFQAEGSIIDIPPLSAVRMTASVIIGYFVLRFIAIPEYEWDDEQELALSVDFIVRGLTPPGK